MSAPGKMTRDEQRAWLENYRREQEAKRQQRGTIASTKSAVPAARVSDELANSTIVTRHDPALDALAEKAATDPNFGKAATRARPRRRPYCTAPDKLVARARKLTLAGAGCLPPAMRPLYAPAEAAALTVIALEVGTNAKDLFVEQIAALAGVCVRTVQSALRKATNLGHVLRILNPGGPHGRHMASTFRIISGELLRWSKKGPWASLGDFSFLRQIEMMVKQMARLIADAATMPVPQPAGADHADNTGFRVQKNADHVDSELKNEENSPGACPA
ncbi:MAG: hypothetical protein VYD64_03215 [Pseudomonadota bacterium]|nr:hypothetical protein [Pseudomonadota bacterium]